MLTKLTSQLFLKKHQTVEKNRKKCKLIKNAGIQKINIDFMYGLEGQNLKDLDNSIDRKSVV